MKPRTLGRSGNVEVFRAMKSITVLSLMILTTICLLSSCSRARENGVTQEELIETITHLAFYAGWPNAVTAIAVASEVFKEK